MQPPPPERREQEPGRRTADKLTEYRLKQMEEQVRVFAPTALDVGVHGHQLEDHEKRLDRIDELFDDVFHSLNSVRDSLAGLQGKIVGALAAGSLLGGGLVAAVIKIAGG